MQIYERICSAKVITFYKFRTVEYRFPIPKSKRYIILAFWTCELERLYIAIRHAYSCINNRVTNITFELL